MILDRDPLGLQQDGALEGQRNLGAAVDQHLDQQGLHPPGESTHASQGQAEDAEVQERERIHHRLLVAVERTFDHHLVGADTDRAVAIPGLTGQQPAALELAEVATIVVHELFPLAIEGLDHPTLGQTDVDIVAGGSSFEQPGVGKVDQPVVANSSSRARGYVFKVFKKSEITGSDLIVKLQRTQGSNETFIEVLDGAYDANSVTDFVPKGGRAVKGAGILGSAEIKLPAGDKTLLLPASSINYAGSTEDEITVFVHHNDNDTGGGGSTLITTIQFGGGLWTFDVAQTITFVQDTTDGSPEPIGSGGRVWYLNAGSVVPASSFTIDALVQSLGDNGLCVFNIVEGWEGFSDTTQNPVAPYGTWGTAKFQDPTPNTPTTNVREVQSTVSFAGSKSYKIDWLVLRNTGTDNTFACSSLFLSNINKEKITASARIRGENCRGGGGEVDRGGMVGVVIRYNLNAGAGGGDRAIGWRINSRGGSNSVEFNDLADKPVTFRYSDSEQSTVFIPDLIINQFTSDGVFASWSKDLESEFNSGGFGLTYADDVDDYDIFFTVCGRTSQVAGPPLSEHGGTMYVDSISLTGGGSLGTVACPIVDASLILRPEEEFLVDAFVKALGVNGGCDTITLGLPFGSRSEQDSTFAPGIGGGTSFGEGAGIRFTPSVTLKVRAIEWNSTKGGGFQSGQVRCSVYTGVPTSGNITLGSVTKLLGQSVGQTDDNHGANEGALSQFITFWATGSQKRRNEFLNVPASTNPSGIGGFLELTSGTEYVFMLQEQDVGTSWTVSDTTGGNSNQTVPNVTGVRMEHWNNVINPSTSEVLDLSPDDFAIDFEIETNKSAGCAEVDSIVKAFDTNKEFTVDCIAFVPPAKLFLIQGITLGTIEKEFLIDSCLQSEPFTTFEADACIQQNNNEETFTVDSLVFTFPVRLFLIDAIVRYAQGAQVGSFGAIPDLIISSAG